jgi:N-[(2S)-2-amino-2-carboxyethyl]-L-glutamate dehydrogenase
MSTASDQILYLPRRDVQSACAHIDPVAAVATALEMHALGETVLPAEGYMTWTNACDERVRSLSMPGRIGGRVNAVGAKVINGNLANPTRGLARANGLTLLFDPDSGRIDAVIEGAYLSALRTAAVSALAADLLGPASADTLTVIGSGVLAAAHVELLATRLPGLRRVLLFDLETARSAALRDRFAPAMAEHDIRVVVAADARHAVRSAQVVVTVTTTSTGYITCDWLRPGALVLNVSLDDVCPDVVMRADRLVVDDWTLVTLDEHRLLGRMYREGTVQYPPPAPGEPGRPGVRYVDAEIGEIVIGRRESRQREDEIVLVNPFGLSLEDIVLAHQVCHVARELGLGTALER